MSHQVLYIQIHNKFIVLTSDYYKKNIKQNGIEYRGDMKSLNIIYLEFLIAHDAFHGESGSIQS